MAQIYTQSPHSELFFAFGDKAGEAQFIAWHHFRHRTYDLIASKNASGLWINAANVQGQWINGTFAVGGWSTPSLKGVSLGAMDLTGPINDDWFYRHAVRHATHRRLLGSTKGFNTYGLPRVNWKSATQQNDWLRLHALDHADLDAFYGLT
jgi:hypothetical protein